MMNKSEFIEFLKKESEERKGITRWAKLASNSDDYWKLHKPAVDWLEDSMDLTVDSVVKITYNQCLYDNDSTKVFETTYDDFVENYDKTVGSR